jgi:RNA recognition motif-containing protein
MVRNLPKDVTDDMLAHIFKFPGFLQVRMLPGKDDLAFVDFETPEQALVAKTALDGYNVTPARKMIVEFSK